MITYRFDNLEPGSEIVDCQIESQIAKGVHSTVYKGYDLTARCPVAIKIMNPLYSGNSISQKRFIRELEIGRKVKHPHLLNVYRYVEESGLSCLVSKWIEGETLARNMQRKENPSPQPAETTRAK